MKELIPKDEYGVFAGMNRTVMVDSLFVAKFFEKEHKNVLRDIENLDCSEEFRQLNFELSYYINEQRKRQPCYLMTRDGFTFLAMGYRGKKAAYFKEMYIRSFNEREKLVEIYLTAKEDFSILTENIKLLHPNPKPYHFSNEINMINRLATGMSTKKFREVHNIPKGESIRPYMTAEQLKLMDKLQRIDVGLMMTVPEFEKRRACLEKYIRRIQEVKLSL